MLKQRWSDGETDTMQKGAENVPGVAAVLGSHKKKDAYHRHYY